MWDGSVCIALLDYARYPSNSIFAPAPPSRRPLFESRKRLELPPADAAQAPQIRVGGGPASHRFRRQIPKKKLPRWIYPKMLFTIFSNRRRGRGRGMGDGRLPFRPTCRHHRWARAVRMPVACVCGASRGTPSPARRGSLRRRSPLALVAVVAFVVGGAERRGGRVGDAGRGRAELAGFLGLEGEEVAGEVGGLGVVGAWW